MNIAFIGGGMMAEAMISGLLRSKLAAPEDIVVSDINRARSEALAGTYRIRRAEHNRSAIEGCDLVVLAIKPQSLGEVLAELKGRLKPEQLVLSIVAGASVGAISEGLEHKAVARVMPNIAVQVGQGVCIWTAAAGASQAQRETARAALAALGRELYVSEERYIDMATAVSGSGPAYIFLVIESFIEAGVHIGLPLELARELVLQTVLGSARLAQESQRHPAELRNMVTSPGGTTAEGLLRLEEGGVRVLIAQAIIAAYNKARALGDKGKG